MSTAVLDAPVGGLVSHGDSASVRTSKKFEKKYRVQLDLPKKSMDRLASIRDMTDASTNAEVIRHAIRLYESMVKEVSSGREFLVREPNGTVIPYKVFI